MTILPKELAAVAASCYPSWAECKCCGAPALLDGYADFDRDCYGFNAKRNQVRGLPIPYYRCRQCDFSFTNVFDSWDRAAFQTHIYNDEYSLFDPRYKSERPRQTVAFIQELKLPPATRIMDYGSGNGFTAELLRQAGYSSVTEYDPFHGNATRPTGNFDLVICVEVAEHSPLPLELFAELDALAGNNGVIFMTTQDFSHVKGRWVDDWYVAPRNGHVSFFSQRTLRMLAASLKREYIQVDNFRHLLVQRSSIDSQSGQAAAG